MGERDAERQLSTPGPQTGTTQGTDADLTGLIGLAAELLDLPGDNVWLASGRPRQQSTEVVTRPGAAVHLERLLRQGAPLEVDDLAELEDAGAWLGTASEPPFGAYCATALLLSDGTPVGFLCAVSDEPRAWEERDRAILDRFATAAAAQLEVALTRDALATAERTTERIVQSATEPMILTDGAGRVLAWNAATGALLGWSADETLGAPFFDLVLPEPLRERHQEELARFLDTGVSWFVNRTVELGMLDRSGQRVVAELSSLAFDTLEGPRFYFTLRETGTHRDPEATAARREQARRNSFLAAIVEQSEDAIVAKDAHGIITGWNRGAEALYGWRPDEAVGEPISIIIPPERAGEEQMLLQDALAGQARRQFETVRQRRDGSRVDVSLSISPLYDSRGLPIGASVVTRDITAQVAQERGRLRAEEQLRVTIEHAPIGVGLVHLGAAQRGLLITANQAMNALTEVAGLTGERALLSAVHKDDRNLLLDALALLAEHRIERRELEIRLVHRGGDVSWVLVAIAPVPAPGDGPPEHAVIHAMDIGERKRFEGQLQHLADHDALTGLYNRRRFETELNRCVAHTKRYGFPGALLLIDLDGFKFVNDTMGHSYGDELVTRVGSLLRASLRDTDVIARIGGDEFAVIVNHAGPERGAEVAAKLLTALRDHAFILADHQQARVTGSIGLTTFNQTTQVAAEDLLIEADIAMYQAKEAGKDRLVVYQRQGPARAQMLQRESWLARLRTALETDGFELLAQPIRRIADGGTGHHELLLRLRAEDGELIRPSSFLVNAERFDVIQQIDRWVFRQALRHLGRLQQAGRDITLSVNLSGKTLSDPAIVDDLAGMLAISGLVRPRLIVEVTETAAITNIDRARAVARGLRELGCQFALDDFGAGFASFYYLKHLEFDYLKIDGEFVRSLPHNPTDQLVIKSVVEIAQGLGARTIAESVGDEASVRHLQALGVDYGQGHHLGRPVPLAEALALPA